MGFAPPNLPGTTVAESPIDRALSLAIAGETEAALRWAAALVKIDPSMPTGLLLCGRLLGELGRQEVARKACLVAVARSIDLENLPLAVVAARELGRFGGDIGPELDRIAEAFGKDSPRFGDGAPPPPPLPTAESVHPLASVLTGTMLINKATEIVHEAKKKLDELELSPGLTRLPLFSTISRDGLRALCEAFRPVWVPQGSTVIQQGAEGQEAYFVARGELEVRREKERDKGEGERERENVVLARLTNGAIFGEMALLSRAPRTGSVVATRPSIVLEVTRDVLDELAAQAPDVGTELAAHCRDRMFHNLVRISDMLSVVPPADRPALVQRFRPRSFEKDERILTQDQPVPGLFLIVSGEVIVVRREEEGGDELVLKTLGPGDVVGEVAMVLRRNANADVITVHPTVTLHLPSEDFMSMIREHPAVLAELYHLAVQRDEETSTIMAEEVSQAEDFVLV